MEEKNVRPLRNVVIELISGFALAAILLGIFAKLSNDILHHQLLDFDSTIGGYIRSFRSDSLTQFFLYITNLGDTYAYIVVVLILLFILIKYLKKYLQAIFLVITVLGSWGLNEVLKAAFHRARPEIAHLVEVDGYSFPSGHAMVSLACYGMIGYIVFANTKEKSKVAWIILAFITLVILTIGVSRIFLGVHFPSDILAGYAAGGIWLMACIYGLKLIRYYQWKKKERLKRD